MNASGRRDWRVWSATLIALFAWKSEAADRYVWTNSPSPGAAYVSWSNAAHTIQEAIDASSGGDVIWVTNGVYMLSSAISVTKGVTLRSVNGAAFSVVDGNHAVGCLYLNHTGAVVSGFTVTNGSASAGGGVQLYGGRVEACLIRGNGAAQGGGVYAANAVTLRNCVISGNAAPNGGGGLVLGSGVTVENCTIAGNSSAAGPGGGVWAQGAPNWLRNCIVYGNTASSGSNWFNSAGAPNLERCCTAPVLGDSFPSDPRFVDPAAGNYRLQSGSPCIDTGTNLAWMAGAMDVTGRARLEDGNRDGVVQADLGAFELPPRFIGPWPGAQSVAAGSTHSLGLLENGQVVAWGDDAHGQCAVPASNGNFVAVAASYRYSLGLKSDGTIVGWGDNSYGKHDVPAPNTNFTAVAAGYQHAAGLKSDGTVVVWGDNTSGQCNIPAPNAAFSAIAGGGYHTLGLKFDGSIVGWGQNGQLQCNVPAPNANFVAVAAGEYYSFGLKSDGRIIAWGSFGTLGQTNVPPPNTNFVAVASECQHSLGLKTGGAVVAWGRWLEGETTVPEPNTNFVGVAAGFSHSLGLKADGHLVGWGDNTYGQTNVPTPPMAFGQASGVVPPRGPCAGGTTVAILGGNLCENGDVTNVTLCGATATVVSASANRVVVISSSNAPAVGDVKLYSATFGEIVRSNAYAYAVPGLLVLGANGIAITNGEAASVAKGTDFGRRPVGSPMTRVLSVTNTGSGILTLGGLETNGAGRLAFQVSGLPAVLAPGWVGTFTVQYAPAGPGLHDAALRISSDASGATNYTVNLRGTAYEVNPASGPFAGGNALTIADGVLGSGSDVTNVLIGGVAAAITGQGTNWVSIITPATGSAGDKDIVIQSTSVGETTLAGAYTVNPAGQIGGMTPDWSQWQEVRGLPGPRFGLGTAAFNGAFYAVGGNDGSVARTNVFRFDGTNWTEVAGLPAPRYSLGVAALNGALVAVGGTDGSTTCTNVYRFTGTNWTESVGLPAAFSQFAAGVLNGAFYTVGGYSGSARANVYRFDGTNWSEVASLPAPRYILAAGAFGGSLYALGGYDAYERNNVYRYNGTNWTEATGLPSSLYALAAGTLNGALYAVGGIGGGARRPNVYRFDGNNWTEVAGLPAERSDHGVGEWNGALYSCGGYSSTAATTNVYRYPRNTVDPGVTPSSGSTTGGYPVVITGFNLGDGSDITNVTLCGAPVASIVSQSATQVIALAGAGVPGAGAVRVFSASYGQTVKSNAFLYIGPSIAVLGTNGALIANGETADPGKGTDFGIVRAGLSRTNTLAITNSGNAILSISGVTTSGVSGVRFQVSGVPAAVLPGGVSNFIVRYAPIAVGTDDASLLIANNATNYTVNLRGTVYGISPSAGPLAGGNTLIVSNILVGSGSDITNVLVGGAAATITGQGSNWVTFTVPAIGAAGVTDVIIQSASIGQTTLAGAYRVNPAGQIGPLQDWTRWQEVASFSKMKSQLAAGVLNNEIYAVGGHDGTYVLTNVCRYAGTNWVEVAGLPARRFRLAAAVFNGSLYAVGGADDVGASRSEVYRFNGTNWAEAPPLPAPRAALAAGVLNGRLYAVGGFDSNGVQSTVYQFDGTNWAGVAPLPVPRCNLAVERLQGNLYGIGGNSVATNVYRFDGTNWSGVSGLPAGRESLAAGVLNDRLYALGGWGGASNQSEVFRFDGTNWTLAVPLPSAVNGLAAVTRDGVLYAIGVGTKVYRYPFTTCDPAVSPAIGGVGGGYSVTIAGTNLSNGSDITNVTLCGVSAASIVSQSATQVVVIAGAGVPSSGDVDIFSASYGLTVKSNGFTYQGPPAVTTLPVQDVTMTTALGGGEVTSDGFAPVMARGLCWGTATNPTLADAYVTVGSGTGVFSCVMITNLPPDTLHHVRAWATNAAGVAYGADVSFRTACYDGPRFIGRWRTASMLAAGEYHTLVLRMNGAIAAWGLNTSGQTDVPSPNGNFVAVACGSAHSLGLKSDGTIVAWGDNTNGQTNVPTPNTNFIAVACGARHSMGLRSDGTIVAWGDNTQGQTNVPAPNVNFVAVAGGGRHSLGLKSDGTIVAWGDNAKGQTSVPVPNASFIAIAAGDLHSLGLKSNGTVVAWGDRSYGQCDTPWYTDFVSIAAGSYHSMAIRSDGTAVTWWGFGGNGQPYPWGRNDSGQCNVPPPNSDFVAVAGGFAHSVGIKSNGNLVTWGSTNYSLGSPPGGTVDYGQESGVVPSRSLLAGGITVTILGANLCDGADVTNVTVCGIPVTSILHQDQTRVVVQIGASALPTNGDVIVHSSHYGRVLRTNGFTYTGPAVVATLPVTDATPFQVEAGIEVVSDGLDPLTRHGLCWGASTNPTRADQVVVTGTATGVFSGVVISNLLPGTFYHLRAWATNTAGEVYGEDRPFGTPYYVETLAAAHGSIMPSGTVKVACGNSQAVAITPDPGYHISDVWVDGISIGATNSFTFHNDTSNHTISAAFAWDHAPRFIGRWRGASPVAGGNQISLGTKQDGSVVCWGGLNDHGPGAVPEPNADFVSVSASTWDGFIGLKSDGAVVMWGPVWGFPAPDPGFMAAAVGPMHSLGLRTDGAIVAGGNNTDGRCDVPAPNGDFVAVAAGGSHSLGLKWNGTVVAWGNNSSGQCSVPLPNMDFVAVAAGDNHSLGLKSDGTIVAWGNNGQGQCDIPEPNTNFVAVATAGPCLSYGLKSDGTIVCWGWGMVGNHDVPPPNTNFVAVAAGNGHALGLKSDGSIVAWGIYWDGQCTVPSPNENWGFPQGDGVVPSSGSMTGGTAVVIFGINMCNGSDVTNVTLCGVPVSLIVTSTPTRIVVQTGAASGVGLGDVTVYSSSMGPVTKTNGFTYVGAPSVTTLAVTDITSTSASGGGDVMSEGIGAVTARGICWSMAANPTLADVVAVSGCGTGVFSGVIMTNLSPATLYHVRAWATNTAGITYGADVSFRTASTYVGPFAGGNTITITDGMLGSGSDITNVLIGGVVAAITGQGTNWVTIIVPATGSAGVKDIIIQSASVGQTILPGAYTVNPAGRILGTDADWTQWQEVVGLPAPRNGLAAGVLNGHLYAIGGHNGSAYVTNVYRFDGSIWTEAAGLPAARGGFAAEVLNGALYAVGGYDGSPCTNVYRYDGMNWAEVAGLPAPRYALAAGVVGGALYAVGGANAVGVQPNVYRFDGTNWTEAAALPEGRGYLAAGVCEGSLYALGGTDPVGYAKDSVFRFSDTNWTAVAGMPTPRWNFAAGVLSNALYAISGNDGNNFVASVHRFDGTGWTDAPALPSARYGFAVGTLGGALYAIGGYNNDGVRTNVYRYPALTASSGIMPEAGRHAGGYAVIIRGAYLGDGSDVTNVTLCGVPAAVVSQSPTQIVVTAGAGTPGPGDVRVYSIHYGLTEAGNAFTYNPTIAAAAGPNGSVSPSGVVEVTYGGGASFVVAADAYRHIARLSTNGVAVAQAAGQSTYTSAWANVTVTGVLEAIFAENLTTNTGTPEWWLAQYGWTYDFDAAATNHGDDDRMPNWAEYIAGTDPTNPASCLAILTVSNATGISATGVVVQWWSATGKWYRLDRGTNLVSPIPFDVNVRSNIPATFPVNSETDTTAVGVGPYFYRIGVQTP